MVIVKILLILLYWLCLLLNLYFINIYELCPIQTQWKFYLLLCCRSFHCPQAGKGIVILVKYHCGISKCSWQGDNIIWIMSMQISIEVLQKKRQRRKELMISFPFKMRKQLEIWCLLHLCVHSRLCFCNH